ncbi:MAG: rane protein of unknown function, partial [Ilumatobacteraceae bacterium]|nr:rane protein of unknown function [Ilumatobacteraceae bacterium]
MHLRRQTEMITGEMVTGEMVTEARAHAFGRAQCGRWWWHAPRSRCVGVRARTFVHGRVRMAIGLVTAALLIVFAAVHPGATGHLVIDSLGSSRVSWLMLAVVLQAGSMGAFAHLQQRVLASAGLRLPLSSALAIVYAGNAVSVTIPFVGSTASVGFTYRQYVQRGASGTMASWAMAVAGVFSTCAFALLVGVGGLANGNRYAIVAGMTSVVAGVLPVAVLIGALRSSSVRGRVEGLATHVLSLTKRVVGRPRRDPATLVGEGAMQLSVYRLRGRHAVEAGALASLNWLLDALCLWSVLQAFDVSLPLRNLTLVYAAAVAAASLGFTPAGIGTVEAAIAVALTNFGSDGAHALPAALAYRAISTWLVLLIGWVLLAVLRRAHVAPVHETIETIETSAHADEPAPEVAHAPVESRVEIPVEAEVDVQVEVEVPVEVEVEVEVEVPVPVEVEVPVEVPVEVEVPAE